MSQKFDYQKNAFRGILCFCDLVAKKGFGTNHKYITFKVNY
jgi:hypothetical protein